MFRKEKVAFGNSVVKKIENLSASIVCSCEGITAPEMTALRLNVKSAGGHPQMGSNRVISKALDSTSFSYISEHLKGSNFTVFFDSDNPLSVIRVINDVLRKNKEKMSLKTCNLGGTVLEMADFKKVASIKSEEQLRAELFSALFLTTHYFMNVLSSPIKSLVNSLEKYYKSKEGE